MRASRSFIILCIVLMAGSAAAAETVRQREQRSADQKQLALRMQEVDRRLDSAYSSSKNTAPSFSTKAPAMKEEAVREMARLQEQAKKQRDLAGRKLAELGSATGPDFDRLKAETNAAIGELNNLYERMSSLTRRAQ